MPFLLNNGLNLWGKIACWSLLAVEGLMQDWQTWYKAEFQERYFSESPWQLVSHSEVILQNNPTKQIIDFAQINKTYVLIPLLVVLLSCYLAQLLFYRHGLESLWEDYVHLQRVFGITICKPQSPKSIYPFHLSPIISKLLHIHKKFMMIMFHIKNHRKFHKIHKF